MDAVTVHRRSASSALSMTRAAVASSRHENAAMLSSQPVTSIPPVARWPEAGGSACQVQLPKGYVTSPTGVPVAAVRIQPIDGWPMPGQAPATGSGTRPGVDQVPGHIRVDQLATAVPSD